MRNCILRRSVSAALVVVALVFVFALLPTAQAGGGPPGELFSPSPVIAPQSSVTLEWYSSSGVAGFFVDVYSPSGIKLVDLEERISGTEGCDSLWYCSLELNLPGESGSYAVWIIPYAEGYNFGDWVGGSFFVEPLVTAGLSAPTGVIQLPDNNIVQLQWPEIANATSYQVDVYGPSGQLPVSVAPDLINASSACFGGVCTGQITVTETGEYDVWINATVDEVFFGGWVLSEFFVDNLPGISLLSPSGAVSPEESVTLVWPGAEDADGYLVDAYAPSGAKLLDGVNVTNQQGCAFGDGFIPGLSCITELPLNGESGTYFVYIIPYNQQVFGTWTLSTFNVNPLGQSFVFNPQQGEVIPATDEFMFIEFNEVPDATGYFVDVYDPVGTLATLGTPVGDADEFEPVEDFFSSEQTCFQGRCLVTIELTGERGIYDVWISAFAPGGFYGPWANSQVEVGTFPEIKLLAPTPSAPPGDSVRLIWPDVDDSAGYFVDAFTPSGAKLIDFQNYSRGSICGVGDFITNTFSGATCELDVTLPAELGEYEVNIIPYDADFYFGEWTTSRFTVEFPDTQLSYPVDGSVVTPGQISPLIISWPVAPGATQYTVDIYDPFGNVVPVGLGDEDTYLASGFCSGSTCSLDVNLPNDFGDYSVWILPAAPELGLFGNWTLTTFTLGFPEVEIISPTGIQSPTGTVDVEWPLFFSAAGYYVNAYSPSGVQVLDFAEVSSISCFVSSVCSVTVPLTGEVGIYDVFIIPYTADFQFGTWSLNQFETGASLGPIDTTEMDVLGSAIEGPAPLDNSEVEAPSEGPND